METFKVGEIAVVAHSDNGEGIGEEVVIESDLFNHNGDMVHKVGFDKQCMGYYQPHNLRKKKPPKEELSTWEEIESEFNWNPSKQKVEL